MIKFWLMLIGWFDPLWQRLGADKEQLNAIMRAKLLMDTRRKSSMSLNKTDHYADWQRQAIKYILLLLTGGFTTMCFVFFELATTALTVYLTIWIVYLALLLITDFTDVLIDVRDNYILFPRPVDDRTITLSRLLHIFTYLSGIIFAFNAPAMVYMLVFRGFLEWVVFVLCVLLSVFLTIFLVNLVYILSLKYLSPRRFKDIIGNIQVAFSILIFGGYMLLPELIDPEEVRWLDVLQYQASWVFPPVWFTGLWELLFSDTISKAAFTRAGLAFVFPLACLWLVIQVFARQFNSRLLAIGEGGGEGPALKQRSRKRRRGLSTVLGNFLCKDPVERAVFDWSWALTGRSREFKIKVYPSFGLVPAYFFYTFFKYREDGMNAGSFEGNSLIFLAYLGLVILNATVLHSKFSDRNEGIWVLQTGPYVQKGLVLVGNYKSLISKFYLPFYLLIALFTLVLAGPAAIADLLLAFVSTLLVSSILLRFVEAWPFSIPWSEVDKGGSFISTFFILMIGGVMALIHYLLLGKTVWILAAILLNSLLFHLNLRSIRGIKS